MKILVGINTLTQVEQSIYANHMQFFYRLGRKYGDKIDFAINTPRRQSIDHMRNTSAKVAIENGFDYLMFIDDDVHIPIDTLDRLLAADKDIVAGWTIIRGYPFQNMFFKFLDQKKEILSQYQEPWAEEDKEGDLIKVDAVGFSCVLIKVSLLNKVNPPYFVTGPYNTEDIYFCMKAREAVGIADYQCYVDTKVVTSHILGPECIDPFNRTLYKKYHEDLNQVNEATMEEKTSKIDRRFLADINPDPNALTYEEVLHKELNVPTK